MSYDKLAEAVNKRYEELQIFENSEAAIKILKSEFKISTSVVWELLGWKDSLDFD